MTRSLVLTAAATVAIVAAGSAQECRNLRYRSNFRLNSAQQYLTRARTATFPDQKARALRDAFRVLTEAAPDNSADQTTLWYLFGHAYVIQGDLVGADSAWTRAAAGTDEECRMAIMRDRQNAWVPLVQEGSNQLSSNNYDSAIAMLRRANAIYRDDPAAFINLASAYMAQENTDSAIVYFRAASTAGDNPRRADIRSTAAFNAARLAQRANKLPLAESLYRSYIRLKPTDVDGVTSLAAVLVGLSRPAEANQLYDSLLAHSDSMTSFQIFDLGVALFRQERTAQAAQAFETGMRRNPSSRDGLFNLVNAYLAAEDTARTLEAAKRLVALDPNNRQSLRLLAGAYQRITMGYDAQGRQAAAARDVETVRRVLPIIRAYQDSTLSVLTRSDSLDWELNIARFEVRDSSASIQGQVRNLQARELAGFVLVLEFVNAAGEVVATERVELPTLGQAENPGSAYDFNLTPSALGIIAYRYRRN
jgi:tetratricopeptide (TPR) repeat protein